MLDEAEAGTESLSRGEDKSNQETMYKLDMFQRYNTCIAGERLLDGSPDPSPIC